MTSNISVDSSHALVPDQPDTIPPRCSRCGESGFMLEQKCEAVSDGRMYQTSPPNLVGTARLADPALLPGARSGILDVVMGIAAAGARPYQKKFALDRLNVIEQKVQALGIEQSDKAGLIVDIAYVRGQIGGIK